MCSFGVVHFLTECDSIKDLSLSFNSFRGFTTKGIKVSNEVIRLAELIGFKEKEAELKELKERLKSLMESHSVKKWTTPNGTHITLVADGEDKEVETFEKRNSKKTIKRFTTII